MGIVDEDSIVLARRGDDLYPALDALRGAQGVRNFSKRSVQCQRGGNDAEGVIDAENAGNAERDGSPLVLQRGFAARNTSEGGSPPAP